jgi:hypothetical protein
MLNDTDKAAMEELEELLKDVKNIEILQTWVAQVINGEFPDFVRGVEVAGYYKHFPMISFVTHNNSPIIVDPELALNAIKCGFLLDVSAYEQEVVLIEMVNKQLAYSSDFGVTQIGTPYSSYRLRYRKNVEELNRKVDFAPEE